MTVANRLKDQRIGLHAIIEVEIVRYEQTVSTRWKNGLGEARQVASWPGNSEAFEWQISIAQMTGKLPFSEYPGVARSLCIIDGDGLLITSPSRSITLTKDSDPLHFPGEEKIVGTTTGSVEMVDFNVMTKRGVLEHQTRRLEISRDVQVHVAKDVLVLFSQKGTLEISCGGTSIEIHERDTAILHGVPGEQYQLSSSAGAICLVADIFGCRK